MRNSLIHKVSMVIITHRNDSTTSMLKRSLDREKPSMRHPDRIEAVDRIDNLSPREEQPSKCRSLRGVEVYDIGAVLAVDTPQLNHSHNIEL